MNKYKIAGLVLCLLLAGCVKRASQNSPHDRNGRLEKGNYRVSCSLSYCFTDQRPSERDGCVSGVCVDGSGFKICGEYLIEDFTETQRLTL